MKGTVAMSSLSFLAFRVFGEFCLFVFWESQREGKRRVSFEVLRN